MGAPTGGGTSSYVAHALTAAGTSAVVKIALPDPAFDRQVRTLLAADGRGYVRVLAYEPDHSAVLLEALGPTLADQGASPEVQIETMCDLLPLAWRSPGPAVARKNPVVQPAQDPAPGPSMELALDPADEPAFDKATSLHALVSRLAAAPGSPLEPAVVDAALACAERRAAAFDPGRCVVVHGDPAPQNTLRTRVPRTGAPGGFVFADPDGFVGDPAYDLGVVLRAWGAELLASGDAPAAARRLCQLIAARANADYDAVWEWGLLERVSTGLYAHSFGAHDLAQPFFESARAVLRHG